MSAIEISHQFILTDYAYETIPGEPIIAGYGPDIRVTPATLG
jgi:hypothetical protein